MKLSSVVAALFLVHPGAALAQECVTCWTGACTELKSYLPACAPKKDPKRTAPSHDVKPPPPAPPGTPAGCPAGQRITDDTEGHCCWEGQAWNGTSCVGVPTECPEGLAVSPSSQSCELPLCSPGMHRVQDGVHCCFAGQAWSNVRGQCVGIPSSCPDGFFVDNPAQTCVPAQCPVDMQRSEDGLPCCWPGQEFDLLREKCGGVPSSCPAGMRVDRAGERCTLGVCPAGMSRASDGVHCCHAGQTWNGSTCEGTPQCAEGFVTDASGTTCEPAACGELQQRADDGVHCCYPGQRFQKNRCRGMPSACPAGTSPNRKLETCEPDACEPGRVRSVDNIHCCFPGQQWNGASCTGTPTSCPDGLTPDTVTSSCALLACGGGRERASDGIHCCFTGQDWKNGKCSGRPAACPDGMVVDGEGSACVPAECASGTVRADDGVHCCLAGQHWDGARCSGVPASCSEGMVPDEAAQTCVLAACLDGRVRLDDGIHCCWPGQRFDGACVGVPTSCPASHTIDAAHQTCTPPLCPDGHVRDQDGVHCCLPGQRWSDATLQCTGRPTSCPQGLQLSKKKDRCVVPECTVPRERTHDGIHCCFPGQDWPPGATACTGEPLCPSGYTKSSTDNACILAACAPSLHRTSDGIHCCAAGASWSDSRGICIDGPTPTRETRTIRAPLHEDSAPAFSITPVIKRTGIIAGLVLLGAGFLLGALVGVQLGLQGIIRVVVPSTSISFSQAQLFNVALFGGFAMLPLPLLLLLAGGVVLAVSFFLP